MSIQWADDFGSYGLGSGSGARMLNGLYAFVNGNITTDPDPTGTGDPVWTMGSSTFERLRRPLTTGVQTAGFACRVWMTALPSASNTRWGMWFSDADNNMLCGPVCNTDGSMTVFREDVNDPSKAIATTIGPVLTANAWHHIEFKVFSNNSTGTIELRINGVTVIEETGKNTTGGSLRQWVYNCFNGGPPYGLYIRDLVTWDTTGSFSNDFLGSVSVIGLEPRADVDFNWVAVGVAEGWEALANSPPLDTDEYIVADETPPPASTFSLTGLPEDVTSVRAIVTQIRAKKIDGGDGNIQVGLVSDGETALGADRPITAAFTYWIDVFHTDPATDAQWAPSAVDDVELQLDRTL